jgi:hypothetical protein
MPFVDGLYSFLASQAGITAIVGSGSSARVYPLAAPQLDLNVDLQPTIVFAQLSRQDIETLKETGKRRTEFELLSMALTHSAAHSLNDAIEAALNHFTGAMGAYTCHRANLQDTSDEVIPKLGVYIVASRYLIFHN